jgi:acyl dehydratase
VTALFRETRTFTQDEFDRFAAISGDDNPIHVDPTFSAETRFGRTVAHGMLLYTALWGLIRREFPDAVQETQDLMFPAPTFAGEAMRLEVDELDRPAPELRDLAVRVVAEADGTVTLDGRTRVRLRGGEAR